MLPLNHQTDGGFANEHKTGTIIAIITMELVSGLSGSAVVKVIIVLLVMALAFVSNVLNMCLYISEKEKNKFSDEE